MSALTLLMRLVKSVGAVEQSQEYGLDSVVGYAQLRSGVVRRNGHVCIASSLSICCENVCESFFLSTLQRVKKVLTVLYYEWQKCERHPAENIFRDRISASSEERKRREEGRRKDTRRRKCTRRIFSDVVFLSSLSLPSLSDCCFVYRDKFHLIPTNLLKDVAEGADIVLPFSKCEGLFVIALLCTQLMVDVRWASTQRSDGFSDCRCLSYSEEIGRK